MKDRIYVKSHYRKKKESKLPAKSCKKCKENSTYCIFHKKETATTSHQIVVSDDEGSSSQEVSTKAAKTSQGK